MEGRFKIIFLVAVLFLTSLPVIGILKGTDRPPSSPNDSKISESFMPDRGYGTQHENVDLASLEEMVEVPAGEFILGSNEGGFNEKPAHVETLESYWIDKYEVTNHQYQQFIDATGHRQPGPPSRYARKFEALRGPSQPVTYVSWPDAQTFCQWKGKRLPTEKEWEKAVRGSDGRTWPWGDGLEGFPANFDGERDGFEVTAPVGSFPKDQSVYGVFDGAGNLMEWVADWYVEDLYKPGRTAFLDDETPPSTYKTMRGGGYTSQGIDLRITNRSFMVPDFRDETIGFRCASSESPQKTDEMLTTSSMENYRKSK
ncbi:MAG: formylglycine-generating enzyme family protein [Nitrospirales bacterium]|nr:formylglycine-generating enzyme family protein [Nitrospirales bacterium]